MSGPATDETTVEAEATAATPKQVLAAGGRDAFLQASADLLLNISPPLQTTSAAVSVADGLAPSASPAHDAMLLLAQSMMEAQAPRPTFADFASVPSDNPFSAPPTSKGS